MTEVASLLRREREQKPRHRWGVAFACSATALALLAPVANSAQLRPDASRAPASDGLQPDAFPGSPTPTTAVAAARAAPAPVGGSLAQVPVVSPPAAPTVTQPVSPPAAAPRVEVHTTPPPVTIAPVRSVATKTHVAQRKMAKRAVHKVTKHHRAVEIARVQLPRVVNGILSLPVPHVRMRGLPAQTAVRRDLLPAALALLALVATSACLLGVAARSSQARLRI